MTPEPAFLVDRMLGPLTRYLRFLGYDCESADSLPPGDPREDTTLLAWAEAEDRILLTRDRELAVRAGDVGIYIGASDVLDQVRYLKEQGVITLSVRLIRCSRCNTLLEDADREEIEKTPYAPPDTDGFTFYRCPSCSRLYWNGSHTGDIIRRIGGLNQTL
ncbi:MAG: hypothetical protein D5R99_03975 [Methanocalculus sp. MSAO_Arc1]|uniref:Mut7-C RNAse domain-containing protein n=1 Tax=Methanocalculus TaxID=71151 RepID=UPI000FF06075|nr:MULTISPECIES: Mut7-C RNAse domain-containing protein [unclassified Methanocalculus]MCP1662495.1 uncharacterized protein with PIN domain [Methanocalculus sp. AMF5]RQD80835.1 MAG: hypothetical protein D5R99_03975 [Methanocalculus sp. MSAO_Arc1]